MKHPNLSGFGSLITFKDGQGRDCCLGYLFNAQPKGVFEPNFGKVEVPPEHVEAHNKALSDGEIQGLDENCQVGQGTNFYVNRKTGVISTWPGAVVASGADVTMTARSISFRRKGRRFRGSLRKDEDAVFFTRVE